ncbi:MAG: 50S ribosomal protein L11 methyltransferase [Alphaproteobacteria bacterium]
MAFEAIFEDFGGAVTLEEIPGGADWRMIAHGAHAPDRDGLEARIRIAATAVGIDPPEISIEQLPATDWVADYHRRIGPQTVGRFFIYPSHFTDPVPDGAVGIQLDAGLAFGTGEHESTRGCLLALDHLANERPAANALDLGCGSGILAIAMAKIWKIRVLGCDIDSVAVELAAENVARNNVAALVEVVESDGYGASEVATRGPFDLITANVLAGPLAAMAGALAQHLAPGGVAVLSGILDRQADDVGAAHAAHGLSLRDRIDLGEWATLVLGRN